MTVPLPELPSVDLSDLLLFYKNIILLTKKYL